MLTEAVIYSEQVIRELQRSLPAEITTLFVYLTMLGEVPLYAILLLGYYYLHDRRQGIALLIIGLSIATVGPGLKEIIALDRPPSSLHDPRTGGGGYGMPSGHTLSAFVIYGSLLFGLDRWSQRVRLGLGVGIVGVVSVSRVVLGVHYPADVLGAWLVGTVLLVVYLEIGRLDPQRTVGIAVAATVPFVLYYPGQPELHVGFGGLVGAYIGWRIDPTQRIFDRHRRAGIGALVGVVTLIAASAIVLFTITLPLGLAAAILGLIVTASPVAIERLGRRFGVQTVSDHRVTLIDGE